MLNEFFELFDSDLVEFELFLFFLQDEQLLFLLYSLLLQLVLNGLYLLVPSSFSLLALLLYLCDLIIDLLDHLAGDYGGALLGWFFGLLFVLFDLGLHLFDLSLLRYVDLVVLPEDSLVLQQFLRQMFAFFLCLRELFFKLFHFLFVLIVISDQLQCLCLLPLYFH